MRIRIGLAAVVSALSLTSATAAQTPGSDLCYKICQYQCFYEHPGGGPEWTQCYLACAETQCYGG
jgi:hypothetical protein